MYEFAKNSKLTECKISNMERYSQELQSAECASMIAINWTFQVLKNYRLPSTKACFTMNTDTGKIATLEIVESTKMSQISQKLVRQVQSRPKCWSQGLWTDTWPRGNFTGRPCSGKQSIVVLAFFIL
jgi:hypothetical protein